MSSKNQRVDFLVLGGGIAGLRAAISLAEKGQVLVLTKGGACESNPRCSDPRAAVSLGEDEELTLHLHDTLRAGEGLCREEAVRVLVEGGPRLIQEVVEWGTRLDRGGSKLSFRVEGKNGRSRVLRAHGNSTESEMLRILLAKAKSLGAIRFLPRSFAVDLLVEGGRVAGATYLEERASRLREARAAAVLLATGGLGQAYKDTTNPPVACGDGVAMAWHAGALLSDMEFVQFCPTALYLKGAPRILLTETLLGDGAKLRNIDLERFMPQHHDAAELAPRDIVSRAMILEMQRTRSEFVYLDLTLLDAGHIKKRFAKIYSACLEFNVDITADLLPVRPAAHYAMGGVATDLDGAASLDGLYAAGEAAATGVHGSNRLAGNALLEGLVFGERAARAMIAGKSNAKSTPARMPRLGTPPAPSRSPGNARADAAPQVDVQRIASDVRCLMWEKVGVIREQKELAAAVSQLDSMKFAAARTARAECEAQSILEVARAIARSALARAESRGAHYRADFPLPDESLPPRHSYCSIHQPVYFEL